MADTRRPEDWRWREAEERAGGRRFDENEDEFGRADYDARYPDDLPRGYREADRRDYGAPDYRGERYPRYARQSGEHYDRQYQRAMRGEIDRGPRARGPGDTGAGFTTDWYPPPSEYPDRIGAGGYGGRERNVMDKAGDEISSWFGDEEAAERRDIDRRRSGHYGRGPRGYRRSDAHIAEDINDRLTDDWRLDASDIEVAVADGEVTLAGTVHTRQDKRLAEDLADDVSGVRNVQNNLRIEPAGPNGLPGGSITAGGG